MISIEIFLPNYKMHYNQTNYRHHDVFIVFGFRKIKQTKKTTH